MHAGAPVSPRYLRRVACMRWATRTQRICVNMSLDSEISTSLPQASATEVEFSRLIASGLGQGRDLASLILLAARDRR